MLYLLKIGFKLQSVENVLGISEGSGKSMLMFDFCVATFLIKLELVSRFSVVELAVGKDLFLTTLSRRFSKGSFEKNMRMITFNRVLLSASHGFLQEVS